PLSIPASSPEHKTFSPIGIIDIGAGPQYRSYKRFLPITSLKALYNAQSGPPLSIRALTRNTTQHVSRSRDAINHAVTQSRLAAYTSTSPSISWTEKEILIPDITDLTTVTTLAQIANNAYIEVPHTLDWIHVGAPWNLSSDFG